MANVSSDGGSDSEIGVEINVTEVSKKQPPFCAYEKAKLLELINDFKDVLEDKRTDFGSLNRKQKAWEDLTKHYCSQPGVTKRTSKQLKTWWHNSKKRAKKQMAIHKKSVQKAGGKCEPGDPNYETESILAIILSQIKQDVENDATINELHAPINEMHAAEKNCHPHLCSSITDRVLSTSKPVDEHSDRAKKRKLANTSSSMGDLEYEEHKMRMKILAVQLEEAELNRQIAATKLQFKTELWLLKIKDLEAQNNANVNEKATDENHCQE